MPTQDYYYSDTAVAGELGAGISNSATSIYLSSTPTGYPSSYPFRLVLSPNGSINSGQSPELVKVTAGSGTSGSPWTIVRGQNGTTAQAWSANATVTHEASAEDFTLSSLHRGSVAADLPHGLPAAAWLTSAFAAIHETTLGAAQASVTWTSIPQTYSHLAIIVQARISETTVQSDDLTCSINGDSGAYYSYLTMFATNISGAGTVSLPAPGDFAASAVTSWPFMRVAASLAGSSVNAGGGFALIPNYTSTAFNKMFWSISGMGDGTSAAIDGRVRFGFYNPAAQAAVTELTLTAPGSSNFNTGSFFGIYGLGG